MMVWSECHFHSTLQTTISHFTLPFPLAPLFDGTLFHFQTYLSSSLEYVGVLSTCEYVGVGYPMAIAYTTMEAPYVWTVSVAYIPVSRGRERELYISPYARILPLPLPHTSLYPSSYSLIQTLTPSS